MRLTDEFLTEIVARSRAGETARQIAHAEGVAVVTVHKWVQRAYARGLAESRGQGKPQWLSTCPKCGSTVHPDALET